MPKPASIRQLFWRVWPLRALYKRSLVIITIYGHQCYKENDMSSIREVVLGVDGLTVSDEDGRTALHLAALGKETEMARKLIEMQPQVRTLTTF